jgi:hypothetical protein
VIKRSWLEQAAKNYDPDVYGARIWIEHLRSIYPDGGFKAVGDVVATLTTTIEKGMLKGKTALLAALKPTPELCAMNAASQKVYTSMEIDEDFGDSGEAYLTGLAVTDSPASLGTSRLSFSSGQKAAASIYHSTPIEIELNFELTEHHEDPAMSGEIKKFVSTLFGNKTKLSVDDVKAGLTQMAEEMDNIIENKVDDAIAAFNQNSPAASGGDNDTITALAEKVDSFSTDGFVEEATFNELKTKYDALETQFNNFKTAVEATPQFSQSLHDGGGAATEQFLANC